MIIYSVTVSLESEIFEDWKAWMQEHHIPAVMNTGFFKQYQINRLLDPPAEPGTVTINIQYECKSLADYYTYQETAAPGLQAEHNNRYKDRFAAFRTLLERME